MTGRIRMSSTSRCGGSVSLGQGTASPPAASESLTREFRFTARTRARHSDAASRGLGCGPSRRATHHVHRVIGAACRRGGSDRPGRNRHRTAPDSQRRGTDCFSATRNTVRLRRRTLRRCVGDTDSCVSPTCLPRRARSGCVAGLSAALLRDAVLLHRQDLPCILAVTRSK